MLNTTMRMTCPGKCYGSAFAQSSSQCTRSTTFTERAPSIARSASYRSPYPEQIDPVDPMSRTSSRSMAASPTLVADSDYGSSVGSSEYYSWSGSETMSTLSSFDSPRSYASFSTLDSYSSAETVRGRPLTRSLPHGVPDHNPGSVQYNPMGQGQPITSNIYGPRLPGYRSSQGSESQHYSGDQLPEGGRSNTPGYYDSGLDSPWMPRSEIDAEGSASWRRPGVVKSDDIYSFAGSASGSVSGSVGRPEQYGDRRLWEENRGPSMAGGWDDHWDRGSVGYSEVTDSESDSDDDSYYSDDDCSSCASDSTGYDSLDYYPEPQYNHVAYYQRW